MKIKKLPPLITLFPAILCLLTVCSQASASVATWDGGAGESDPSWHTPSNWSDDTLPIVGDDVVFPNLGGRYNVEYDPESKGAPLTLTLKNITQEASTSGLYLKSGTLGFSGNMECLNYNRLYVQGGTLDAAGPLQFLSGSGLTMSSGTLLQRSTMQFDSGSSLNMTGGLIQVDDVLTVNSSSVSISKGTIQISSTLTGTGVVIMGGFSPFEILSLIGDEAVLNMTGGGTIGIGAFSTIHISGTFTNQGSASLGGTLRFNDCTFNNAGSIQTIGFGAGAFEAEAGTNVLINRGSFQASSSPNSEPMAIKIPFVNKSGGTLAWNGPTFHDTVTNEAGAVITGQNIDMNGGTLVNQGQITTGATEMNGNLSMSETSSLLFQGKSISAVMPLWTAI